MDREMPAPRRKIPFATPPTRPRKTPEPSGRNPQLAMNAAGNQRPTTPIKALFLTINGGSCSIKFALFQSNGHESGDSLARVLQVKGSNEADNFSRPAVLPDHQAAMDVLMDWIEERVERGVLTVVGRRIVHGGPKYWQPQRITPEMLAELHSLSPFDPEHLPEEIELAEAFHRRLPDV